MTSMHASQAAAGQDPWTLAVDLGCAHLTAVVTTGSGSPEPLEFDGQPSLPSGVWMDSDGRFVVGTAALRQALLAPQRWEPAPVRLLAEPGIARELGGAPFEARDAVAELLSHALHAAHERLGRAPARTVLVCPQTWTAAAQDALAEAARRAGLERIEVLGSADAAARYLYGAGLLQPGQTVAVADVGAGSVGAAVVRLADDGLTVLASSHRADLGGNTLDVAIFERVVRSMLVLTDPSLEVKLLQPEGTRWHRVREMSSPDAWVYTVALNQVRTTARRRGLEQRFLRRQRPPVADPVPAPDVALWDAVAQLPPRTRSVVALRYVADFPEARIAEVLGITRGTVASTLHEARRRLADRLATSHGGEER